VRDGNYTNGGCRCPIQHAIIHQRGRLVFHGPVLTLWSTGERLHVVNQFPLMHTPHLFTIDWPWQLELDTIDGVPM
jgi:hypothetical protein